MRENNIFEQKINNVKKENAIAVFYSSEDAEQKKLFY